MPKLKTTAHAKSPKNNSARGYKTEILLLHCLHLPQSIIKLKNGTRSIDLIWVSHTGQTEREKSDFKAEESIFPLIKRIARV